MTGLLFIITLLLVAIVAWMICITLLYLQQRNDVIKMSESTQKFINALTNHKELTGVSLQGVYAYMNEISEEIETFQKAVEKHIERHTEENKFATETIQQTRRLQAKVEQELTALKATPGFYTGKEPEENAEEPRS